MEPFTHFFTGACMGRAGLNRKTAYATLAATLAAEAADMDIFWGFRDGSATTAVTSPLFRFDVAKTETSPKAVGALSSQRAIPRTFASVELSVSCLSASSASAYNRG